VSRCSASLVAPSRIAPAGLTPGRPKSCTPRAVPNDSSGEKVEFKTAIQGRISLAADFNGGAGDCQRHIMRRSEPCPQNRCVPAAQPLRSVSQEIHGTATGMKRGTRILFVALANGEGRRDSFGGSGLSFIIDSLLRPGTRPAGPLGVGSRRVFCRSGIKWRAGPTSISASSDPRDPPTP